MEKMQALLPSASPIANLRVADDQRFEGLARGWRSSKQRPSIFPSRLVTG